MSLEVLPPTPPENVVAGIRFERCASIEDASQRVYHAGLFVNDEETSHILNMVVPLDDPNARRHDIKAVWFAVDETTGKDVGTALVSPNPQKEDSSLVLNLYVDDDYHGHGIGSGLLGHVLSEFPQVSANYTLDSVRIYARAKVKPANLPLWFAKGDEYSERLAKFTAQLLQDRFAADQEVSLRSPVFRP